MLMFFPMVPTPKRSFQAANRRRIERSWGITRQKALERLLSFQAGLRQSPPTGLIFWIKPKFNPPPQYVLDILDAFRNARIPIESVRLQDDIGDAPLEIWVGPKPIK